MDAITALWSLLQSSAFLAALLAILIVLVLVLFVAAFLQGRSMSLWPPRVGAKPTTAPGKLLKASPLTPDSPILNALIESSLETVCRAVSLPQTPQAVKIRVFIFKKEDDWLVCRYYWSQDPVREQVGKLRFEISAENAQRIAVVRALRDERICRTAVAPLPGHFPGITGDVDDSLTFVLAAPIFDKNGAVWGTVDFDTATDGGKALLSTEASDAVMHQLARHLSVVFNLET
jgi:hypothetical protein